MTQTIDALASQIRRFLPLLTVLLGVGGIGLPTLSAHARNERYGGIEIGAKGVKAIAIEVAGDAQTTLPKILLTKSSNTTVGALKKNGEFETSAIEETADAVADLFQMIRDQHQIAPVHVFIVGSSFVAKVPNRDILRQAIKQRTGHDLDFLTVQREVELSFKGLVLLADRPAALLLDIGSGNTKGGSESGADGKLQDFSLQFGTVSYTTAIRQRLKDADKSSPTAFLTEAKAYALNSLTQPLAQQLGRLPGLTVKSPIYLTGGTVWAMTALLHPEAVNGSLVPLSSADIDRFRRLIAEDPESFPAADFSRVSDPAIRRAAEIELKRVRDTFTVENLIAGGEILHALSEAFDLGNKRFYFARNSQFAWILAYITPPRPTGNGRGDLREDERDAGPSQKLNLPPIPAKSLPK